MKFSKSLLLGAFALAVAFVSAQESEDSIDLSESTDSIDLTTSLLFPDEMINMNIALNSKNKEKGENKNMILSDKGLSKKKKKKKDDDDNDKKKKKKKKDNDKKDNKKKKKKKKNSSPSTSTLRSRSVPLSESSDSSPNLDSTDSAIDSKHGMDLDSAILYPDGLENEGLEKPKDKDKDEKKNKKKKKKKTLIWQISMN